MGIFDTAKLDAATIAGKKLTTLTDRPNAVTPYGNNLTSAELKAWFTSMVEYIGARYTTLITALEALTAAGGIGATDNATGLKTSIQALFNKLFSTAGLGTENIYFADNSITPVVTTAKVAIQDLKTRLTAAESDIDDIETDNATILAYLGGIDENGNISILDEMIAALAEITRLAGIADNLGDYDGRIGDLETGKQDALTFDTAPTAGSENMVKSGAIKTAINNAVSTAYKVMGSVANYAALPTDLNTTTDVGKVYNIIAVTADPIIPAGGNVVWTGTAWDILGGLVDLSGKLDVPTVAGTGGQFLKDDGTWATVESVTPTVITLNANGGTVTPSSLNGQLSYPIGTLPTPTRSGYTFQGWFTASIDGTEVTSASEVTTVVDYSIYAQWEQDGTDGLEYTKIAGEAGYEVSAGTVTTGAVKIASTHNDGTNGLLPVTRIKHNAFRDKTAITSIYIPDSVITIAAGLDEYGGAFGNCTGLTSIRLSENLTTIGKYAFYYCSALTSLYIPASVTSIANGNYQTFAGCSSLTQITGLAGMTNIDCFKNCTALTSITIPSGVTNIGYEAFKFCYALVSVIISRFTAPSTITAINSGAYPFADTNASLVITVPYGSGDIYKAADNWVEYAAKIVEASAPVVDITSSNYTNYTSPLIATPTENNILTMSSNGGTKDSGIAISTLAPLANPTFTGTVTVPTAAVGGAAVNKTQMEAAIATVEGNIQLSDLLTKLNAYILTFDYQSADGGNTLASRYCINSAKYGVLPTPTRTSTTFKGWYTELPITGGTQVTSATEVSVTANHTLYAQWEEIVSFDFNGGSGTPDHIHALLGGTYGTLPTPTPPANQTFVNWQDSNLNVITSSTTVAIAGAHTLTAYYTSI